MRPRPFDPHGPGTPAEAWSRSPLAHARRLAPPGPGDRVAVLVAHPDDETLGAGGLIALTARQGVPVRVVLATDGENSHPGSPTHAPPQLAAIRRAETDAALRCLGDGVEIVRLGLPDGALTAHSAELADRAAPLLDGATHVVTTMAGDGHPDHEACAAAVASLAGGRPGVVRWQFPVWAWHWADPDTDAVPWEHLAVLELDDDARAAKRAALDAYVSQHAPLSPDPADREVLPAGVLAHFARDVEAFVVTAAAADGAYFDRMYAGDADPWRMAERFYEQRKHDLLAAALPRPRFRRAFEPGCGNGELTRRLAARCDEVLAWDRAGAAVAAAAARVPANVTLGRGAVPDDWPPGRFDLVVLSELGYYLPDLDRLAARVRDALTADGVVVACHWRRPAPDHPRSGDDVHDRLARAVPASWARLVHHEEPDFLLDVWSADPRSVAQVEGLTP